MIFGTHTDITASKKAEALLQQTRLNYETFFNTIDEFLFVLDETGNILHANSTVYNRLGYTAEELFQKSVLMVHPPERREEAGRIVGEMLSGQAALCPVPIITKSGVQIPVETRVSLGSWDGKPAIFGVTKDIDNILIERYWHTIKRDYVYLRPYNNGVQMYAGISKFINRYNRKAHQIKKGQPLV